jgi:hypothetical protein
MTAIDDKYRDLGGPAGFLGEPVTAEQPTSDGRGRVRVFQGGTIYWTTATGAHEVHGLIRGKYQAIGAERSPLGYPVTDESRTPDQVGRYSGFQFGSIYWTPATGAFEVHGRIGERYQALGGPDGLLGYPLTDETGTPDRIGRYNHFQNGSIYWTPRTDAHEVHGAIRGRWSDLGWERGLLGYPISDEHDTPDGAGRVSDFQGGKIVWSRAAGATERVTAQGYTVTLERFHIDNTRAADDDTDVVSFTVAAAPPIGESSRQENVGDVDNGDHQLGWRIGPLRLVDANESVKFSYAIVNAGYANSDAAKVGRLLQGLGQLCSALCAGVFGFGGIWVTVASKFVQYVGELLSIDCDGPVAGDAYTFTAGELHDLTAATGKFQKTVAYHGTDSNWGCGSNSEYTVTWSITYEPAPGPVT